MTVIYHAAWCHESQEIMIRSLSQAQKILGSHKSGIERGTFSQ